MQKIMSVLLVVSCVCCSLVFAQSPEAKAGQSAKQNSSRLTATVKSLPRDIESAVIKPVGGDKTFGYWREQMSKHFRYKLDSPEDFDLDAVAKGLPDKPLTVWQFAAALYESCGVCLWPGKYSNIINFGPMPEGISICLARDDMLLIAAVADAEISKDKTVKALQFVSWRYGYDCQCRWPGDIFAIATDGSRYKLKLQKTGGNSYKDTAWFVPEKPLKSGRYKFALDVEIRTYTDRFQASISPVIGKTPLAYAGELEVKKLDFGPDGCDVAVKLTWDMPITSSEYFKLHTLPRKKAAGTITPEEKQQLVEVVNKFKAIKVLDFQPYCGCEAISSGTGIGSSFNNANMSARSTQPVEDITSLELIYATERRSLVPIEIELDF